MLEAVEEEMKIWVTSEMMNCKVGHDRYRHKNNYIDV